MAEKKEEKKKELKEELKEEPKQEKELGLKDDDFYENDDEIIARIEERRRIKMEKKKRARKRQKIGLGCFAVLIGLIIFSFSSFFTIDYIDVQGNTYFSSEEIINMAHAEPGKNLIYHPQKGSIEKYLEDNPYIESAKVSRKLPSTLVITVEERDQVAALKFDEEYLIIDNNGILLRKTKTTPKLTEIEGLVVKKVKVGEKLGVEDEDLFNQALDIISSMNKKDLYFVRLDMREMYIRAYIYESFVCKGTYEQLMDGINEDKLHRVLDKLMGEGIKRGTITFSDDGYVSFVPSL